MVVVACALVLARVPSVCNFGSITLLFSNHTSDIGVTENNGVTFSKSWTVGTQVRNQICTQWPPFLGCPNGKIRERCTSQLNARCIIPERVMHRFAKVTWTLYNSKTWSKSIFHSKVQKIYLALDLLDDPRSRCREKLISYNHNKHATININSTFHIAQYN
jgi:hypothetical protein